MSTCPCAPHVTCHIPSSGYRDSAIDHWNRRTQLASGQGHTTTFKVLNQSVLTQIATVMQDDVRLVRRTQMRRGEGRVLGAGIRERQRQTQHEEKRVDQLVDGRVEEYDEEIYDDTDYYQQLLREIISHGGGQ